MSESSTPTPKSFADCLWDNCFKTDQVFNRIRDPHAKDLLSTGKRDDTGEPVLNKNTAVVTALQERLRALNINQFTYIDSGLDTLVLGAITHEGSPVAVRVGGSTKYPDSEYMLKPFHSEVVEGRSLALVEQVTRDVTFKEARQLMANLYREKFYLTDVGLDNLGRTRDGRIVVIDPKALANADGKELDEHHRTAVRQLRQDEIEHSSRQPPLR